MLFMTVMAWAIIIGFPLYGLSGASGRMLCYAVFVTLSGLGVNGLALGLAQWLPQNPALAGYLQFGSFLALAIAVFPLAIYCHRFLPFSFEPFDSLWGFIFGGAAGVLATFYFLTFSLAPFQGTPQQAQLEQTFVVQQFLRFDGVHAISNDLLGLEERGRKGPSEP